MLGVGLGDDGWKEFSSFSGETTIPRRRAALLDESLEAVRAFLRGRPVDLDLEHLTIHSSAFLPRPVQDPLPIWVACRSPHRRPIARAARNEGCFPLFEQGDPPLLPRPGDVERLRAELTAAGAPPTIDIVCRGATELVDPGTLRPGLAALEAAGMTWWLDSYGPGEPADEVLAAVSHGPPGR